MMKRAAMFIGCILFAASAQAAVAKTSGGAQASSRSVVTTHELVLRDGSRMYGTIEREDDVEVVFRTQAGALVTARRVDIASLEKITGGILNGEFLPPNRERHAAVLRADGPFGEEGADVAWRVRVRHAVRSVRRDRSVLRRRRHAADLRHRRIGTAVLDHAQAAGARDAVDPGRRWRPPRLQHGQRRGGASDMSSARAAACSARSRLEEAWPTDRTGGRPASSWWVGSGPCAATSS